MQQDQYPHLIIFVVRAGSRLLRLPIRTLGDNLSPVWTPRNEALIIPSFVRLNFREYPISARFRLILKVNGFDWTSCSASGLPGRAVGHANHAPEILPSGFQLAVRT